MKLKKEWSPAHWLPYTITACLAILFYYILNHLPDIAHALSHFLHFISPVIYGIIIAYVMNPLVEWFEEKIFYEIHNPRRRRTISITVASIVVIATIVILTTALVPQIINSILTLFSNFSVYAKSLTRLIQESTASSPVDLSSLTKAGTDFLTTITNMIPKNINSIINTSVNIGASIFNLFISIILALYFLSSAHNLQNKLRTLFQKLLKPDTYQTASSMWRRVNHILVRYIVFDILDGIIIGIANFIFFIIMGIPYSILISVIVGITNLAPTFGPIVGGIIGAFILILVNPWYAVWFILFTLVLQTLDGYIIKPKLFGNTLGVSSLWILVCLIVLGRMFSVWGILLAIPFAAITDFLVKDFFWNKKIETKD